MNYSYFNLQCLSNAKGLFSETLSPKKNGQVSFDKTNYQGAVLVSFDATPPNINTDTHTGKNIYFLLSSNRKVFATKLRSLFGFSYRNFRGVGMKLWSLKAKDDCSFWSSTKGHKGFSKINYTVDSSLQKWIISHPCVIRSTT